MNQRTSSSPPPLPPLSKTSRSTKKPSLLIPTKRLLLSPADQSKTTAPTPTKIHKTLNPSSIPAGIRIRKPAFSSIRDSDEQQHQQRNVDDADQKMLIETDFSCPPQPFLDVDVRERWEVRRREKENEEKKEEEVRKREMGEVGRDVLGLRREVHAASSSSTRHRGSAVADADADSDVGGRNNGHDYDQSGQLESEYGSMAVKTRRRTRISTRGSGRTRSRRARRG